MVRGVCFALALTIESIESVDQSTHQSLNQSVDQSSDQSDRGLLPRVCPMLPPSQHFPALSTAWEATTDQKRSERMVTKVAFTTLIL